MNELLKRILFPKKVYRCNVSVCGNEVDFSGDICARCKATAAEFRQEQESLDEWFKKISDTTYLGALLNFPIPENDNFSRYFGEQLKKMLHERDERIADVVNKGWINRVFAAPLR